MYTRTPATEDPTVSTNRRLLPIPDTAPSGKASRLLREIQELVEAPETPEERVQLVVDLLHLNRATHDPIDTAMYEAVRNTRSITFHGMADKTGMSRAGVQLRVDNGDPAKPSRWENVRQQRERAAARESEDPSS